MGRGRPPPRPLAFPSLSGRLFGARLGQEGERCLACAESRGTALEWDSATHGMLCLDFISITIVVNIVIIIPSCYCDGNDNK